MCTFMLSLKLHRILFVVQYTASIEIKLCLYVFAYKAIKTIETSEAVIQKVAAVVFSSFARGCNCKDFSGKIICCFG